jgi:hypothetical protein
LKPAALVIMIMAAVPASDIIMTVSPRAHVVIHDHDVTACTLSRVTVIMVALFFRTWV